MSAIGAQLEPPVQYVAAAKQDPPPVKHQD
jgi:hypothetical protein